MQIDNSKMYVVEGVVLQTYLDTMERLYKDFRRINADESRDMATRLRDVFDAHEPMALDFKASKLVLT